MRTFKAIKHFHDYWIRKIMEDATLIKKYSELLEFYEHDLIKDYDSTDSERIIVRMWRKECELINEFAAIKKEKESKD
jgi:hypothetical protein